MVSSLGARLFSTSSFNLRSIIGFKIWEGGMEGVREMVNTPFIRIVKYCIAVQREAAVDEVHWSKLTTFAQYYVHVV